MQNRKITAALFSTFLYILIETIRTIASSKIIDAEFVMKVMFVLVLSLFLNFFIFPRLF